MRSQFRRTPGMSRRSVWPQAANVAAVRSAGPAAAKNASSARRMALLESPLVSSESYLCSLWSATMTLPLADFTLLLSTTDEYSLLQPCRDRMKLLLRFQFYDETDLIEVLRHPRIVGIDQSNKKSGEREARRAAILRIERL